MHTDHTLLNVVRSRGPGRIRDAVVIDNLETKPNSIISKGIVGQVKHYLTFELQENKILANPVSFIQVEDQKNYYHDEDFEIGKTVEIAGRSILIHDCDEFTKKYFKTTYDKGAICDRINSKTRSVDV